MPFLVPLLLFLTYFQTQVEGWVIYPSILEESNSEDKEITFNVSEDCGEKLFLTELIEEHVHESEFEKGKRGEEVQYVWREQARVQNLSDAKSYSGFFTVNKKYNSNMFFWFFPAAYDPEKAPLILWLNGGPGTSSLFGLFVENGPFKVNSQGSLEHRQYAWTLVNSVIYIDNPVGTGFSFTEDDKGYSKTQIEICDNLFHAMQQFFRAFPEYSARDFYIAGESYAGKYVPALALKIHLENRRKSKGKRHVPINLKGIMVGSGYFDPPTQNDYGQFLYHLGLIDSYQMEFFLAREGRIKQLLEDEEWAKATKAVEGLMVGDPDTGTSLFKNFTGFTEYLSVFHSSTPKEFRNYLPFLNKPNVRQAIHVGDQPYTRSPKVVESLTEDISQSVRPWIERLLREDYRILIYSSQLDLVVPHVGIQNFISTLDWDGARLFARAPRRPWKVNGDIAGYTKFAKNLAYILVRNAGHVAPYDQPSWIYDMVNRFTRGNPF